jgi:hypothetical protein
MVGAWTYEIEVQGRIGERWAHWFEGMSISAQGEAQSATTTLTGAVADQAALLGLLQKLYTLGLPLLLVQRREPTEQGEWRDAQ